MRVATFNLLHGMSVPDGRVVADRLSAAVAALDADVLGLQEVDAAQPRSGGLDMVGIGAAASGAVDARFVPALVGTPGETWRPATDADGDAAGRPAYGIGLVSRHPVREWRVVRLGMAPVRSPVIVPGSRRPVLLADEPRVGVAAVLDTPGGRLTVATAHLSFVPGWNVRQLRRLIAALADLPGPVVLVGDLNLPGRLPALVSRWRSLARVPTYPSWRPRVQLDHALATEPVPRVTGVSALGLPVSDHCALAVNLAV